MSASDAGRRAVAVLLVDDQILMREGLHKLLEIEPGIDIVGSAANGEEALALLAGSALRADVALVDARMPGMGGVELVGRLRTEFPKVAPLMLTTFDDDDYIFGGLSAGAQGYLLKDTPPDELVDAIRRAARGETVLGRAAAERVVAALRESVTQERAGGRDPESRDRRPRVPQSTGEYPGDTGANPAGCAWAWPPGGLSEREHEIALLVGAGSSNREIARRLHITEGTTKNHISNILRKLALRDRTQLAVWIARAR